jgi:hypothetical protein
VADIIPKFYWHRTTATPPRLTPTHPHAPETLWEAVRQIVQLVRSLVIFDISSLSRFVSDKCQMKQYWMVHLWVLSQIIQMIYLVMI